MYWSVTDPLHNTDYNTHVPRTVSAPPSRVLEAAPSMELVGDVLAEAALVDGATHSVAEEAESALPGLEVLRQPVLAPAAAVVGIEADGHIFIGVVVDLEIAFRACSGRMGGTDGDRARKQRHGAKIDVADPVSEHAGTSVVRAAGTFPVLMMAAVHATLSACRNPDGPDRYPDASSCGFWHGATALC